MDEIGASAQRDFKALYGEVIMAFDIISSSTAANHEIIGKYCYRSGGVL